MTAYNDAVGRMPDEGEVREALERARWSIDRSPELNPSLLDAQNEVLRGALQVCALRLMDQGAHVTKGENEMYGGIACAYALRGEEGEIRAARAPAPPVNAKPRARRKLKPAT